MRYTFFLYNDESAFAEVTEEQMAESQQAFGAYADTKEQLGGYFAVDVKDLDEAIKWAEKCPSVHYGIIEVRPTAM